MKNREAFSISIFVFEAFEQQTNDENNVLTRCAQVIEIFTDYFSCIPLIASEKITFHPLRLYIPKKGGDNAIYHTSPQRFIIS